MGIPYLEDVPIVSDVGNAVGDVAGGIKSGAGAVWDETAKAWRSITGQAGAEAAREAGDIQAGAIGEAARIQSESAERSVQLLMEQLGITREQFAPFVQAGVGALGDVQQGATTTGLDQRLNEIMGGDFFGGLVEERQRGVQGQLAAGGLTRSGAAVEEAARVPTDLAFQIENLLSGRQQNLVSMGQSAAAGESGQTGLLTQNIIQALTGGAAATAQGITGAAGATASGILGGAQSQAQGTQNLLNTGALLIASDPRLKENVRHLGKIGKLDLVEWDWIPELGDDFFKDAPRMGFMADKVKEIYPEFVHDLGGYDAVDYSGLRAKLTEESATWH